MSYLWLEGRHFWAFDNDDDDFIKIVGTTSQIYILVWRPYYFKKNWDNSVYNWIEICSSTAVIILRFLGKTLPFINKVDLLQSHLEIPPYDK